MQAPINVKSPNNISKWQMGFNSAFKGLINEMEVRGFPPGKRTSTEQDVVWAPNPFESRGKKDHLPANVILFPGCRVRNPVATVTNVRLLLHKYEYQRVPDFLVQTESCHIRGRRVHT
jgi:hypothetical protein